MNPKIKIHQVIEQNLADIHKIIRLTPQKAKNNYRIKKFLRIMSRILCKNNR